MSKFSIFMVLLVFVVISSLLNPNFLSQGNLFNILKQLAVPVLLSFGAMMLIVSGMIDLSAGSVLALAGVLSVTSYKATNSLALAVVVGLGVGVLANIINAVMVVQFKVPAFIATLAMQMVARGAALYYSDGQNILQIGGYTVFGQSSVGVIPISVIIMLVVTILIYYIMKHTKLGRSMYAIGGNEEASIASGINVKRNKYMTYIINGLLVGAAGILFMSRVNAGLPNGAVGYEMEGLTATIVGGTSFSGGAGTTLGTLVGALIIGVLNNIMNLTSVNSYIQQIVKGAIIAVAVIWDIRSKRGGKKITRKVRGEQ
ncbi:MAG: ABC transporter permease [Clostridiaceae bacterium]